MGSVLDDLPADWPADRQIAWLKARVAEQEGQALEALAKLEAVEERIARYEERMAVQDQRLAMQEHRISLVEMQVDALRRGDPVPDVDAHWDVLPTRH